ncbi:MAG: M48 family metallopeptidase [Desulfobulbaceae bacterium]|nr:M48 family metallopeptidase [Desulfobulbaceae bacterium]
MNLSILPQPFTIELSGIGPVLMAPSRRASRLILSIRPFKGIRLAIPEGISLKKATAFLNAKRHWLQNHLPRIKQMEAELTAQAKQLPPIDKAAAQEKLPRRLKELAQQHNFTYNRVTIRNQKSRWGSCSTNNNISLNMKLLALPDELIDYVLLHELLHTKIKNHGPAFWANLNLLVANAKEKRAKLKAYPLAVI